MSLLALCAGNLPVTGEFPAQRPVTRSFDVFFDLCLDEWSSKESWGWWFKTPSHPLWCHCNELEFVHFISWWVVLFSCNSMTSFTESQTLLTPEPSVLWGIDFIFLMIYLHEGYSFMWLFVFNWCSYCFLVMSQHCDVSWWNLFLKCDTERGFQHFSVFRRIFLYIYYICSVTI